MQPHTFKRLSFENLQMKFKSKLFIYEEVKYIYETSISAMYKRGFLRTTRNVGQDMATFHAWVDSSKLGLYVKALPQVVAPLSKEFGIYQNFFGRFRLFEEIFLPTLLLGTICLQKSNTLIIVSSRTVIVVA